MCRSEEEKKNSKNLHTSWGKFFRVFFFFSSFFGSAQAGRQDMESYTLFFKGQTFFKKRKNAFLFFEILYFI
jgi:hypothetical protein